MHWNSNRMFYKTENKRSIGWEAHVATIHWMKQDVAFVFHLSFANHETALYCMCSLDMSMCCSCKQTKKTTHGHTFLMRGLCRVDERGYNHTSRNSTQNSDSDLRHILKPTRIGSKLLTWVSNLGVWATTQYTLITTKQWPSNHPEHPNNHQAVA